MIALTTLGKNKKSKTKILSRKFNSLIKDDEL